MDGDTPAKTAPTGKMDKTGKTDKTDKMDKTEGAAAPNVPANASDAPDETPPRRHKDPTRYGDWEIGGRCIDF